MDVSQAIRAKRAVREFRPERLPPSVILSILNAGRRAQSSKNSQPWSFLVVQDRERLQALSRAGTYASHLAGAAAGVVLTCADPASRQTLLFDLGQAAAYMQLAAWELGVGSCLATIYEPEQVRHLLGIPADQHAPIALSFGYPADPDRLTAPPRRTGRRALAEMLHWERWGGAAEPTS
jgi:nitroreductase